MSNGYDQVSYRSAGLPLRPRPPQSNPRNFTTCPTHLKRICGVCEHFAGAMREPGACRKFGDRAHGLQDAAACQSWTRRSAPYEAKASDPVVTQKRTRESITAALADRRAKVKAMLAENMSGRQIAAALGVSYGAIADDRRVLGMQGELCRKDKA